MHNTASGQSVGRAGHIKDLDAQGSGISVQSALKVTGRMAGVW